MAFQISYQRKKQNEAMRLNQPQHLTSLWEVDANLSARHIKLVLPSPLCCTYPPPPLRPSDFLSLFMASDFML